MVKIKKKILVIGGTGYIGKNVCKRAVSIGLKVDSLSLNKNNNDTKVSGVNYIYGDLLNQNSLMNIDLSYDFVVNASGYVDHTPFFRGGETNIFSHFVAITNLIKFLNKNRLKKFLQIGSSDEYGNNIAPQNENLREEPISPYSLGKVATTHFLQMLSKTEKFPVVILRVFLTYGPGQNNNRLIPQIIHGCMNNSSFPTSEGMQLRDFCFIEDLLDAIFLTLNEPNISGEIINIGSGKPIRIRDLVEEIRSIIGKGKPQFGDFPYRKHENMELYADLKKSEKLLNWKPKTTLKEGLKKTINWYLNNEKAVS